MPGDGQRSQGQRLPEEEDYGAESANWEIKCKVIDSLLSDVLTAGPEQTIMIISTIMV
jgi:hypothetical protein